MSSINAVQKIANRKKNTADLFIAVYNDDFKRSRIESIMFIMDVIDTRLEDDGIIITITGQGDYVGSTIERSNREYIEKNYEDFITIFHSGYGYRAIKISADNATIIRWAYRHENHDLHIKAKEFMELLESLNDYPVADEELLSEIEEELKEEYFQESINDWKRMACNNNEDLVPISEKEMEEIRTAFNDHAIIEDSNAYCDEEHIIPIIEGIYHKWLEKTKEIFEEEYEVVYGIEAIDSFKSIKELVENIPSTNMNDCERVLKDIFNILIQK